LIRLNSLVYTLLIRNLNIRTQFLSKHVTKRGILPLHDAQMLLVFVTPMYTKWYETDIIANSQASQK